MPCQLVYHLKNGVFWDVMQCGSCKNRRFRRNLAADPPQSLISVSRPEPLIFFQVAPYLFSQGLSGPHSRLTADNRTRDLWVSSQELWPLDHRGGPIFRYTGTISMLGPISKLNIHAAGEWWKRDWIEMPSKQSSMHVVCPVIVADDTLATQADL
jgi:hypothetical protein